jgi:hypothetical protein
MKKEEFCEVLGDINESYVEEARAGRTIKKPGWMKWVVAACLALVIVATISLFPHNNDGVDTTPGTADAVLMICVNDTLYKQSTSQTSFSELKDDFAYLGIVESDVTNSQSANDAGTYWDGIPKENFQANHPIVGAEVYQYGDDIVVEIEGKYWLYEPYVTDLDGNPDGYDPLPNSHTSDEEVSEQDPAAN